MKTTKAAIRKASSSPSILSALVGTVSVVVVSYLSTTKFDECVLFLLLLSCLVFFYLQNDFVLDRLRQYLPADVLFRIPTKECRAALTIDDVPLLKASKIAEILDVLNENKVKATFFIMSGFTRSPDEGGMNQKERDSICKMLKRAVQEGHELGNHMEWDLPSFSQSPEDFERDFVRCDNFLKEMYGGEQEWRARPHRWFRPASALWSEHILAIARKHGYTTAIANCYPHDVAAPSRFINAAYLRGRVRPGAIIVVHDRWHTPETLRKALPDIVKSGLKLGTLSDLQAVAARTKTD